MSIIEDAREIAKEHKAIREDLTALRHYLSGIGDRQYFKARAHDILNMKPFMKYLAEARITEIEKRIMELEK